MYASSKLAPYLAFFIAKIKTNQVTAKELSLNNTFKVDIAMKANTCASSRPEIDIVEIAPR